MNKILKTIGIIGAMTVLLCGAYWLGTMQAETVTEVQTVTEIKEVIPDGYIQLDKCIPLEDVACCFIGGYDYPCFELKDIGYQLDNPNNRSYADIMENLEDVTEEYKNKFWER